MLQILNMNDNEAFLAFKNGLKSWARQKLKRVPELSKAMTLTESIIRLKSFESEEGAYVGETTSWEEKPQPEEKKRVRQYVFFATVHMLKEIKPFEI